MIKEFFYGSFSIMFVLANFIYLSKKFLKYLPSNKKILKSAIIIIIRVIRVLLSNFMAIQFLKKQGPEHNSRKKGLEQKFN